MENLNEKEIIQNNRKKHNLKKIDTKEIRNSVLINNTYYAFKKSFLLGFNPIYNFIYLVIVATVYFTKYDVLFGALVIGYLIYLFLFVTSINKRSRKAYNEYLEDKMLSIYNKEIAILNFVPENVDYQSIRLIEVSGVNYENAKYNLIKIAFNLEADGIISLSSSSSSTSHVVGVKDSKVETIHKSVVYMQGMAIKLN
ncbi:hypothetical protein [Aliarcobacter thereius]|uniref:hypothetical protein n=1 Tax=Aliarcobacter thereius TaxID=544718 RepID=UPI000825BB5A|nr:hypothetical protein [Aliarcobacter thereius]OCL90573.1 hypothetical protein AAX25_01671 [Aliarcobacter thereius]